MTRLRKPFATNLLSICIKKINMNVSVTLFPILLQEVGSQKYRAKMQVPFLQTSFFLVFMQSKEPDGKMIPVLKMTQKYPFFIALTFLLNIVRLNHSTIHDHPRPAIISAPPPTTTHDHPRPVIISSLQPTITHDKP